MNTDRQNCGSAHREEFLSTPLAKRLRALAAKWGMEITETKLDEIAEIVAGCRRVRGVCDGVDATMAAGATA